MDRLLYFTPSLTFCSAIALIYEADYVAKGSSNPNTNSFRGVVDCTIVNDVAADFLEREIKRYY